jgi:hypothetical protein
MINNEFTFNNASFKLNLESNDVSSQAFNVELLDDFNSKIINKFSLISNS